MKFKMQNVKLKFPRIFILSTLYLLLSTFLIGCATAPVVSVPGLKETVRIDGARYVSAKSLCEVYNIDYYWDPIAKKVVLKKDDKEARIMVNSSTALLNKAARTMDKEAKFYRGMVFIPHSFARRTLGPFFREEYIERKVIPTGLGPIRNVIIDPGHGGRDPGAIGRGGLKEKDVVLDIAKRLKRKLNAAGINIILTRASDKFVSLSQRSRIANTNADVEEGSLFISIHANASRSRWVSGVEVFYLSESIDDNLRSLKAARNYDLNIKEGYSGKNTPAIIWDLLLTEYRRESKKLARLIGKTLCKKLYQRNRGIKQARFYVLKTNIPAVLVEVGFISNSREEKRLRDASYRDKIAQGIAVGITQYNRQFRQRRTARY